MLTCYNYCIQRVCSVKFEFFSSSKYISQKSIFMLRNSFFYMAIDSYRLVGFLGCIDLNNPLDLHCNTRYVKNTLTIQLFTDTLICCAITRIKLLWHKSPGFRFR